MRASISPEGRLLTVQDLSQESGVSVASIKFYVREGLLFAGDASRPGRAYYDGAHVRRLAVIRAMRDVAGLSIDVMRRALAAVDAPHADAVDAIAPAIDALATHEDAPPVDAALLRARRDVATLFTREKIVVRREAGARETLARAIASLRRLGYDVTVDDLRPYVASMRALAKEEIGSERARTLLLSDKEGALEIAILGSLLFEPILVALRRALHEQLSTALVRARKASRKKAARARETERARGREA
ncbi:MAG: MerR family transcriptional regulator [Labilithrix sp.]|nr:MerR family transcriptional regulator [Labilithrix sp.]